MLNTNADSVAAAVAVAMAERGEVEAVMCLDKPGVLLDVDDPNSVIPQIDKTLYEELKSEGKIFSGMIPKLDNAFAMIASGVAAVRITDAAHLDGGTLIVK
jgi:acetylglutamate kinase